MFDELIQSVKEIMENRKEFLRDVYSVKSWFDDYVDNGDLVPPKDQKYSLGSSKNQWRKVFAGTIIADVGLDQVPIMDDAHIPDLEKLSYGGPFDLAQIPNRLQDKVLSIALTAAGTINAGDVVYVSGANEVDKASDTERSKVIGIAASGALPGNSVEVKTFGRATATADGSISAGDPVAAAPTPGRVVSLTTHAHSNPNTNGIDLSHSHSNPSTAITGSHTHGNPSTGTAGSHTHSNPSTGGVNLNHTHSNPSTAITGSHTHSNPSTGGVDLSHTHSNPDTGGADPNTTLGDTFAYSQGFHTHSNPNTGGAETTLANSGDSFAYLLSGHSHYVYDIDRNSATMPPNTTYKFHAHSVGQSGSAIANITYTEHLHHQGNTGGTLGVHSHTVGATGSAGSHSHSIGNTGGTLGVHSHTVGATGSAGSHYHTVGATGSAGSHSHSIGNTGGTLGVHSHTQPNTGTVANARIVGKALTPALAAGDNVDVLVSLPG